MALTDHKRELAFQMFGKGSTSREVASRIRESVPSVRALRANWTRNNSTTTTRSTRSRSRTSTTPASDVGFNDPVVVRLRSSRLIEAVKEGRQINLVIDVK